MPSNDAQYLPPSEIVAVHPEVRAVGWTAEDVGRLGRMGLARRYQHSRGSLLCVVDVVQLAAQVRR